MSLQVLLKQIKPAVYQYPRSIWMVIALPKAMLRESIYKVCKVIGEWNGLIFIEVDRGVWIHSYVIPSKRLDMMNATHCEIEILDNRPVRLLSHSYFGLTRSTDDDKTTNGSWELIRWKQAALTQDELKSLMEEIAKDGRLNIKFTEKMRPSFHLGRLTNFKCVTQEHILRYNGKGHWIDGHGWTYTLPTIRKICECYEVNRYTICDSLIEHMFYEGQ